MKLYDNDSFRETFMKRVYELLADDPDNYRANEIIDLFDNAPEFNPPNEWVSVEERLPEYNPGTGAKSYWVAKKDNAGNWQMKIAQYCDYGYAMTVDAETEVTWRDWDFTKIVNVTHWMPLPAPPGKDNNVPTNEPLTPDQLRGMYGEPVWVTSARERGNIPSRWVLFAGVSKSKRNSDVFVFATTGGIAQGYEAVNYGKTWNAYRRPLGGEEDQHGNHRL